MKREKRNKNRLFSFKYFVHDFVKVTAAVPGLIWFRPKWVFESDRAKEAVRGGALAVSNHYGFFDPMYLMFAIWYRRHHFVCGKEFFEGKARHIFKAFLCIPIDRANFGIGSLREITAELKRGSLVTMFPEGHINGGGSEMASFKSGMVLMALQGKVPIIPIYIKPKRRFYSRVRFAIGERIDVASIYGPRPTFSQIEEIAEQIKEKEEHLKSIV